jgi:hypothetical protein
MSVHPTGNMDAMFGLSPEGVIANDPCVKA